MTKSIISFIRQYPDETFVIALMTLLIGFGIFIIYFTLTMEVI